MHNKFENVVMKIPIR